MQRTVEKEFRWEAAHRLIQDYQKKCKNIHGHSYVAKVVLKLREGSQLNSFGFVKDYGDFKPLKDWFDNELDHATLVSNEDRALLSSLNELNSKAFVIDRPNTTAEYLAEIIFIKAVELLQDESCEVVLVKVNETCTSEATYGLL